jgi:hypothetical protein
VQSVFWLEDDWHNCEFELAFCEMNNILVEKCSSVTEALNSLSQLAFAQRFVRFVFDVNLQVEPADLEIFPRRIDLTRDLVGLEFFSLLSDRAPESFAACILPNSVFYTKMIAQERLARAQSYSKEKGVGFVRKSSGLHASRFLKDLGLTV